MHFRIRTFILVVALALFGTTAAAKDATDPCAFNQLVKVESGRVLDAFNEIWAKTGSVKPVLLCQGLPSSAGLAIMTRFKVTKDPILLLSDEVAQFGDDALRGVLAHEIGHYVLGHTNVRTPSIHEAWEAGEKEADIAGVQLVGLQPMEAMVEAVSEVVHRLRLAAPADAMRLRIQRLAWIRQTRLVSRE